MTQGGVRLLQETPQLLRRRVGSRDVVPRPSEAGRRTAHYIIGRYGGVRKPTDGPDFREGGGGEGRVMGEGYRGVRVRGRGGVGKEWGRVMGWVVEG